MFHINGPMFNLKLTTTYVLKKKVKKTINSCLYANSMETLQT